jgi:hypothetical protein
VYFSEKYGIVFGTNDLVINFSDMEQSCSKLGGIYEIPEGMNENSLTGLNPISQVSQMLSQSMGSQANKTVGPTHGIPIWDVEEVEVFSLMLYK